MLGKLKLLGVLLAIPLIGYYVLGCVISKEEQEWRQAVQQNFKDISPDRLNAITLKNVCENAELASKVDDACSTYSHVQDVRRLSLWACVVSVLFPLLVMLAGWVCKANRNLLLSIFAPGLYVTNLVVSAVVVMQGIVLMGTVYYGESAFTNRVHYGYIILFGFAALAGAFYIIKGTFGLVKRRPRLL